MYTYMYICVHIYIHGYLNIDQHFCMLKKLYTLNEDFENLDVISGPGLKSAHFINSVPDCFLAVSCFSLTSHVFSNMRHIKA